MSLDSVHDSKVLPSLLNPLRREIELVSADGAYDTQSCCVVIGKRDPVNQLAQWKAGNSYHQRSLAETAMYSYKQLLSGKITLRKYNGQVGEILANANALNKLTSFGIPCTSATELIGSRAANLGAPIAELSKTPFPTENRQGR